MPEASDPEQGFFAACRTGDVATLRALLSRDPDLVRARNANGSTGLHLAVQHVEAVRLLLEHGADPNARDTGDNIYPLHMAAACGYLETVRALLDAGGDVHGVGDLHNGDVIGWAVGDGSNVTRGVVALLLERGARHHIFSALALDDQDLVRAVVAERPEALARRRSRFEQGQTPLHFALAGPNGLAPKPAQYAMADLLISLGADLEAKDDLGRTPLEVAMLQGDLEAMRRLKAAGAREPDITNPPHPVGGLAELGASIRRQVPMLSVADMAAAVAWYGSIGFTLRARHPEEGEMDWASLVFGTNELMLVPGSGPTSLWFYTDRLDELYQLIKARQLSAARAALAGGSEPEFRFEEDLHAPFYGGRQFSVRNPDGLVLNFMQE